MGRQGFPGILGTEGVKVKKTPLLFMIFFLLLFWQNILKNIKFIILIF